MARFDIEKQRRVDKEISEKVKKDLVELWHGKKSVKKEEYPIKYHLINFQYRQPEDSIANAVKSINKVLQKYNKTYGGLDGPCREIVVEPMTIPAGVPPIEEQTPEYEPEPVETSPDRELEPVENFKKDWTIKNYFAMEFEV